MKFKFILFSFLFVPYLFSQTDSTTIVKNDTCEWLMPNVITYYCSSIYDWKDYEFFVASTCAVKVYHIEIYNRWGEVMYESTDINKYWYAKDVDDGSYIYQITGVYSN